MNPHATFDPPDEEDVPTLLEFMRAFSIDQHIRFDAERTLSNVRQLMIDETYGSVRVIKENRVPVGYLVVTFGFSFEFGGPDAFVDEIFVDPAYRGRGIGSLAIAAAENICRARGVRAVHLEVDAANEAARRLYRSAGFEDHQRLLMTKRLVE